MTAHFRSLSDVAVGDELTPVEFPLSLYKLVMEAGANRDFNSIHHNSEFAKATGAPEAYANTLFLMGMWERLARDWAGPQAEITAFRGFRMGRFNVVGSVTRTSGSVIGINAETGVVTLSVQSGDDDGVTVGPGEIDVRLHS